MTPSNGFMKGRQAMATMNEWEQPWFNRGYWIFEHLEDFHLDSDETLVLIVMNYLMETNQTIDPDILCAKTNLSANRLDQCLSSLSEKGYFTYGMKNKQLVFSLDGLFEYKPQKEQKIFSKTLFTQFSDEFGRPLSSSEMDRLIELQNQFEESMILHALDEASAYNKRSLNYIEAILANWQRKGLDAQDIESGKR